MHVRDDVWAVDGIRGRLRTMATRGVHFTLGPGEVSFGSAIVPSVDPDVTTTGTAGASTPIDCSSAFVTYCTVVADSPI